MLSPKPEHMNFGTGTWHVRHLGMPKQEKHEDQAPNGARGRGVEHRRSGEDK